MINIRICTLVVAITFFISGCSSNQKKYLKKLPDIPSNWSSIYEGDDNSNGWVSEFKDETLYGLIKEALENNKDLGIAFENVKIARARAGASLAPLLPAINVGAAKAKYQQLSKLLTVISREFIIIEIVLQLNLIGKSIYGEDYQLDLGLHILMLSQFIMITRQQNYLLLD